MEKDRCNDTNKECGFLNFTNAALEIMKKYDIADLTTLNKTLEVLQIIFEAPSIIEQLFKLGQLGKKAEDRYFWGTITDSRVEKVKEFFADGKRDQSK